MRAGSIIVCVSLVLMSFQFPIDAFSNTDGPTFPLEVSTDKYYYMQGEEVVVTLTNVGDKTIEFLNPPGVQVVNSTGHIIVNYCPSVAPVIIPLDAGETLTRRWDQEHFLCSHPGDPVPPNGEQVAPGRYKLIAGSGNARYAGEKRPVADSVWIEIGPAGDAPVADAGPDQTVYVGDTVHFNGSGSHSTIGEAIPIGANMMINDVKVLEGVGGIPRVALDSDGGSYVTWTDTRKEGGVFFDYASNLGTFGPDKKVGEYFSGWSDISLSTNDDIHIAWVQTDILYSVSTDGGLTFSTPVVISEEDTPPGYPVRIDAGTDGSIHVVWGNSKGKVCYRSSSNGGGSWNPSLAIADGGFPDVAISENGSVYVTWQGLAEGSENASILLSRKIPNGSFEPAVTAHPIESFYHINPSIVVGPNGEIHIAWVEFGNGEYRIAATRSLNGGLSFETPNIVRLVKPAEYPGIMRLFDVAATTFSFAGVAIAWAEYMQPFDPGAEIRVSISLDRGESFGAYRQVDDLRQSGKRMVAIDGNSKGDLYVAWHDGRDCRNLGLCGSNIYGTWVKVSSAPLRFDWDFGDGSNHSVEMNPTHIYSNPGDYNVALTVTDDRGVTNSDYCIITVLTGDQPPVADAGPDQTVHEGDIVQFNGTGSRGSPSNRTIITEDGSEDYGLNPWKPRAASSPDGTLYVVWLGPADADEFHRRIFLSKRDTAGSWEAPVQVTSWSKYENAPSIAVGSLGEIHIAFESFVPESDLGDIYVVSSFDAGRTFENPVRVDDAPSGMGSYYPEIEVASDGTVYVAWYDTRNGGYDVYVASSRDACRSFSQDRIVNDTTGQHIPPGKRHSGQMHPTLDSGPAGTLYVAWPSGVAWSGIWADRSTDYGDSWNTDLRIDNSTAWGRGPERPSLIVDPNGSIHVFWADYRLGNIAPGISILMPEIYYTHSEDDGVSYAPNQKANPEEWRKDRAAGPPSSASDSEGTLFVAYPFLEGWYNHTVRAIVSTDHGSSFQLNASLDTRLRPGEWLARDIVEAYSWRSGCFGMVWMLEHLEPGVKVVVWDSCLSTSEQNVITSYEWDFDASIDLDGDGNYTNDKEATGPTPTHIYYDDGIYVATLTITDSQGLPYTDQCNISVLNVPPTPEWTSRSSDGTILNPPYPEGKEILFTATVHDPGIYDTFTYDWDFGDGTIIQDAGSSVVHAYGDNDAYIVVLIVTDDDGGIGVDDTPPLPTTNEDPVPKIDLPFCIFVEGLDPCEAIGMFSDPGWLDTHSATWDFGDGTTESAVLFEKHDPPASTGWNLSSHLYGDDGLYTITFTVTDDDGGTGTATAEVPVQNHPPSFDLYVPITVNEGEQFVLGVEATDPGSDDLRISVDWGDGTYDSRIYYNNGIGPDPPNSAAGVYPFVVQTNFTHVYPDDGDYDVTVMVEDDDGGADTKVFQIPVLNVAPTVTLEVLPIEVNASLRIAGEKWHDVTIEMYEDGELIAGGTLVRYPGSPDDQRLDLSQLQVDYSKKYSAIVRYTPEDDPVNGQPNGANPCWIILTFTDGEELWIHHTFNVQHPDTYIWEVDLTGAILMHGLTFEATAFDPGADDLTFHWDFGDGTNVTTFYPNVNETYPVEIMEIINHVFPGSGTYTVVLTVEDDDGGIGVAVITVTIP